VNARYEPESESLAKCRGASMTITLESRVYLRACRTRQPGTVVRVERGKLVVFWRDLDHWSRHVPDSLELAEAPRERAEQVERTVVLAEQH
jgi:hypothetical protein